MKGTHSTKKVLSLILLAVSATFLFTFLGLRRYYGADSERYGEIRAYREAREIIAARYVGDYTESDLTDDSLRALVTALSDRWSYYLTAEEYEQYRRSTQNQHQGIGIAFLRDEETGALYISSVTAGSPAQTAGLLPGEAIVSLDGEPVAELENETVRQRITDKLGGAVQLEVESADGVLRQVEVQVEEFYSNPVAYERLEGDIGYIAIGNFDGSSGDGAVAAIEDLLDQGAESLIFDVRGNPGGQVGELLTVLDHLLPEGELFVYADKDGRERIEYSDAHAVEVPVAVLVDAHSYSAAEYFAAILQEYDRAEIVGEQTTGKGRSQVTIPLSGGGALHLSTSRYFTPNRVDLSEAGGITPDVVVSQAADEDAQLAAAVSLFSKSPQE